MLSYLKTGEIHDHHTYKVKPKYDYSLLKKSANAHFNVAQNEYPLFFVLFLGFFSSRTGDTIPATVKPPVSSQSNRFFRVLNGAGEKYSQQPELTETNYSLGAFK